MPTFSSMNTSMSGIEASAQAIETTADNLVNANTTAFKASRSEFQSVLAQEDGGGRAGVVSRIEDTSQGALTKTALSTDVAIEGEGFFGVRAKDGTVKYTRDGNFKLDAEGFLTTLSGERVQAAQGDARSVDQIAVFQGKGKILNRTLESSNVDLAKEFVAMIRYQRSYQANAKALQVSNDLLEETLHLRK